MAVLAVDTRAVSSMARLGTTPFDNRRHLRKRVRISAKWTVRPDALGG